MENVKQIANRLGEGGRILMSRGGNRCPDVFEIENGDFLIIGEEVCIDNYSLPNGASCDDGEKAVLVPKAVMLSAIEEVIKKKKQ